MALSVRGVAVHCRYRHAVRCFFERVRVERVAVFFALLYVTRGVWLEASATLSRHSREGGESISRGFGLQGLKMDLRFRGMRKVASRTRRA